MLAAIGGVALKHWYYGPEFYWHAGQVLRQARGDPLCLFADTFPHQGLYFSLSVWHDVEAMLTFAQSGPHRRVMQASSRLANTYRVCHFPCIAIPTAKQALQVWAHQSQAAK